MTLQQYLDEIILPQYDNYDKGHNRDHILDVVNGAIELAKERDVNIEMILTAAYFHDLGLIEGRETHHITSAKLMRNDKFITSYFSPDQIKIISEAIEDHRASAKKEPRSIYGEIISSADRIIKLDTIITRTFYYSEKHFPEFTLSAHIERIYKHISEKYGENGYLRIPILTQKNKLALNNLRSRLTNKEEFKQHCVRLITNLQH